MEYAEAPYSHLARYLLEEFAFGGLSANHVHKLLMIACMDKYCLQSVLDVHFDEVDRQEACAFLRMMPRMYLAIKDLDLVAATWPCLQDMPMVATLQTKPSLA